MIFNDFLLIGIGTIISMYLFFYVSHNKPRYTIPMVIKGNIMLKRGMKFLLSFLLCFLMKFGVACVFMAVAFINDEFQAFYEPTKHWFIPLVLPILPSISYLFFITKITPGPLKPKPNKLGKTAEIFQFINEMTIQFWNVSIKDANTWYSRQIVRDINTDEIINLIFERKKLAIAFKVKNNRPLFPLKKHSKTHYLMNHYKFDDFNRHLRDHDFKNFLISEFTYGKRIWGGTERRRSNSSSDNTVRIGDFKHINSVVNEGLTFDLEVGNS